MDETPNFVNRPWLYVAAPYSSNPLACTADAIRTCDTIIDETDWFPICPHLTMLWDYTEPHPVGFWYAYDLAMLARCDAIVRLPGASTGADREIEFAIEHGIKVLDYDDLPDDVHDAWGRWPGDPDE